MKFIILFPMNERKISQIFFCPGLSFAIVSEEFCGFILRKIDIIYDSFAGLPTEKLCDFYLRKTNKFQDILPITD